MPSAAHAEPDRTEAGEVQKQQFGLEDSKILFEKILTQTWDVPIDYNPTADISLTSDKALENLENYMGACKQLARVLISQSKNLDYWMKIYFEIVGNSPVTRRCFIDTIQDYVSEKDVTTANLRLLSDLESKLNPNTDWAPKDRDPKSLFQKALTDNGLNENTNTTTIQARSTEETNYKNACVQFIKLIVARFEKGNFDENFDPQVIADFYLSGTDRNKLAINIFRDAILDPTQIPFSNPNTRAKFFGKDLKLLGVLRTYESMLNE